MMDLADRPSFPASQVLGPCEGEGCSGPVVRGRPDGYGGLRTACYACGRRHASIQRTSSIHESPGRGSLHRLLEGMDPEDLGLSPLGGTISGP